MRRQATGTALALACLAACTTGTADPPGGADDPVSPRSQSSTPSLSASAEPEPQTEQPLVLAIHATSGPVTRIPVSEARRLLAGRSQRWDVVAAPGMPVGDGVRVAGSAREAIREVHRDPAVLAVVPAEVVGPDVQALVIGGADPIREPEAYPLTVAGPPPPRPTTLTVVGDIMLGRGVPDPRAALAPMSGRLRSADLTVGNLESTLSDAGEPQQPGNDSFYAPPSVVRLLADAGFDALSLANNHTGDYQDRALLQTVRRLRASPVEPFGAGRDRAAAAEPAILEANGTSFGFLGFNAIGETPRATPGSPGALSVRMPPRTGPLRRADLRYVERQVRQLDGKVDVVVVVPHWGGQYTHRPEPAQRRVARRLVVAGADLVVGGHPHWVQGVDLVEDTVVAHSLGNFIFDMDFLTQTMQGVVLEATYWGDSLKALDLVPYRMGARFAPRIVRGPQAADILGDVWSTSTGPFAARR